MHDLIDGVQFFDNFADNGIGAGVPINWTKLEGSDPTIAADLSASGSKVLHFPSGTARFAMRWDLIPLEQEYYEILVRMRTNKEEHYLNTNPFSDIGGPAGHLQFTGGKTVGVAVSGTNKSAMCVCGLQCRNCQPIGRGLPNAGTIPSAYGWNQIQQLMTYSNRADGDPLSAGSQNFDVDTHLRSGPPKFVSVPCPGSGSNKICHPFQTSYGDVVDWNYMLLRVGPEVPIAGSLGRVRAVWWKEGESRPESWYIDGYHITAFLPALTGSGLGLIQRQNTNRSAGVIVDFVSVSLDPDQAEAPMPDDTSSICPLPDGRVGSAYSFNLDLDGIVGIEEDAE